MCGQSKGILSIKTSKTWLGLGNTKSETPLTRQAISQNKKKLSKVNADNMRCRI